MYKGLFNEKIELIIKGMRRKSYSKTHGQCAKLLAVCFATIAQASWGNKTDNYTFQTDKEATNAYKSYLSEVRNMGTISTERLIESVNEWQILRDSVYACIAKGTTSRPHQNPENTVRMLHDSLRIEFTRLALSQPRSFADVLLIKEKTYQYRQDTELAQAVTDAEPFFRSLDSVAPCHGNAKQTVSIYQSFLANTLKSGISAVPFFPEPSSGACRCRPFCHYARHGEMLPVDIPVSGEWQALLLGCLGIYSQANQPKNHT